MFYHGNSMQSIAVTAPSCGAVSVTQNSHSPREECLYRRQLTVLCICSWEIWLQGISNKVNSAAIKRINSFHQEELGCLKRLGALYCTAAVSLLPGFLQRRQFGNASGSLQHPSRSAFPAAGKQKIHVFRRCCHSLCRQL